MNGKVTRITATYYCKCGASIRLTGTQAGINQALKLWSIDHQGEGHDPCDRKTCLAARRAQ